MEINKGEYSRIGCLEYLLCLPQTESEWTRKTWPLPLGQELHGRRCQVLASRIFQQRRQPLQILCGARQVINRSIIFFNQKATGLAQLFFPLGYPPCIALPMKSLLPGRAICLWANPLQQPTESWDGNWLPWRLQVVTLLVGKSKSSYLTPG